MKDPILVKLKADTAIVLADIWRALRHQPTEEFCRDPRVGAAIDYGAPSKRPDTVRDLCYFHLN